MCTEIVTQPSIMWGVLAILAVVVIISILIWLDTEDGDG